MPKYVVYLKEEVTGHRAYEKVVEARTKAAAALLVLADARHDHDGWSQTIDKPGPTLVREVRELTEEEAAGA